MVNKDIQNKEKSKPKVGISNDDDGKKTTISLNEAKKKARSCATKSNNEILVKDIYQNVSIVLIQNKYLKNIKSFIKHKRKLIKTNIKIIHFYLNRP